MMLTAWKILKTFGNLPLVHLLQHSQEAECPLVLPVTPNSLGSIKLRDQNVMHFLWSLKLLRFPGLGFLCKKSQTAVCQWKHSWFRDLFSVSKSKLLKTVPSFSVLRSVPVILMYKCSFPFLSSKFSFLQTFHSPERLQLQRRASGLWKTFSWYNPVMYHLGG